MPRRSRRSKPSGVPSSRNIYQALVGLKETRGAKGAARALGVSVASFKKATSPKGRKSPAKVLGNPAKWNERLGSAYKKQAKATSARVKRQDKKDEERAMRPPARRRPLPIPREPVYEDEDEEVEASQWKENESGVVRPGDEGYADAVRFVKPGVLYDGRARIEYRGSNMTKLEAIYQLTEILRSVHVIVVVEYDDHVEMWLDYEETKK